MISHSPKKRDPETKEQLSLLSGLKVTVRDQSCACALVRVRPKEGREKNEHFGSTFNVGWSLEVRKPTCPKLWAPASRTRASEISTTANLRTKTLDFRGLHSSIMLFFWGGILMSMGDFPEYFESTNLSGDNLSGEIGRTNVSSKREWLRRPPPASRRRRGSVLGKHRSDLSQTAE